MILQNSLKSREIEIVRLMADGLSNREIAEQLLIGVETVKWHAKNIYQKLGVSSRKEAAIKAQALGLLYESKHDETQYFKAKHNLREASTAFIGREDEIKQIHSLLLEDNNRLMTILAPGGMGKTRLSIKVARRQIEHHTDGVYFVPLAPLSSSNDIVTTIAENIGFVFHGENKATQQLVNFLKDRSMLLILDNFEHLLEGVSIVSDIIHNTTRIKILITSRERLNVHGEHVYHLNGLVFPTWETPKDALEYDSVKLFIQSARRTRTNYQLVPDDLDYLARICKLTAGMPLGIELAAGWIDILSLEQIAGELQQGIDILETNLRDVPERHQSLRATFERTWNRLEENEQRVFMRLSIFRGGFTLESANVVAGAIFRDLRILAQKALIQIESHERYVIHELVRQFGASKLEESTEFTTVQANHATYFTDFMVEQEHNLKNGRQLEGLTLIDSDFENVRLAWNYVIDHHQWEQVTKFRYSFWFYYSMRARSHELILLFDYALQTLTALPSSSDIQVTFGRILAWSSWFYHDLGYNDKAINCSEEAINILQASEDSTEDLIIAYHTLGREAIYHTTEREAALSRAKHNYELAVKLGDPTWLGQTASFHGVIGVPLEETYSLEVAKKWFGSIGDRHGLLIVCIGEGQALIRQNRFQEASRVLQYGESLIAPFKSAWHLAQTNRLIGICMLLQDDNEHARYNFSVALQLFWESGYIYSLYGMLLRIAQVCINENNLEMAVPIMLVLNDAPSDLRDINYKSEKAINAQMSYDELRSEFKQKLKARQLKHLWEQVQKPTLSELITELLADLKDG